MLRALHPRCLGDEQRLVLARVQVSPASRWGMVVADQLLVAFRATERFSTRMIHMNSNLTGIVVQFNLANLPRRLKSENLLVKFFVLHRWVPPSIILRNPLQTRMDLFSPEEISQ